MTQIGQSSRLENGLEFDGRDGKPNSCRSMRSASSSGMPSPRSTDGRSTILIGLDIADLGHRNRTSADGEQSAVGQFGLDLVENRL